MNEDSQLGIDFGTEPRKLARRKDPDTSKEAAEKVNTARWEQRVYAIIKSFGRYGCIQSDVLRKAYELYGFVSYSTITARFKGLEEKGLIAYTGEKRKGTSGRQSRVRVAL